MTSSDNVQYTSNHTKSSKIIFLQTSRLSPASRETNDSDKTNFKHLLLETIEELQSGDKKEQKITLKKLLNSIQNCSKPQNRQTDRVKVYHFLSKDLQEEMENIRKETEEEKGEKQTIETIVEEKEIEETAKGNEERRLNKVFKTLEGKYPEGPEGGIVPKGRIQLKITDEIMNNASKYRKAFAEYRKNNIMYKKTLANTPWELVGKVSDRIILDIIEEISTDLENDALLRRLYLNELLEVTC